MSKILFATMPITGHINPGLPIARKLIEHGHEVDWYTGAKFKNKIEQIGCRFHPSSAFATFDDANLEESFPDRKRYNGVDKLKFDLKALFTDPVPACAKELLQICQDRQIDVVVVDTAFAAGPVVTELGGPPCVAFGITALPLSSRDTAPFGLGITPVAHPVGTVRNNVLNWVSDKVIFKDVIEHRNRVRRQLNLPDSDLSLFDGVIRGSKLYLQGTVEQFEYPRSDMPKSIHFVGPLLHAGSHDLPKPDWWSELSESEKPIVHVSQGTIATDPDELIIPALEAMSDLDVLVVVSSRQLDKRQFKLPRNARLAEFLPYTELMPMLAAFVTNGGYGGVHYALSAGVPMVVAGTTEDKPEVANRVEWCGAGINLKTSRPHSDQIRAAVRKVLRHKRYKQAAARMQEHMAKQCAATRSAELIAEVAAGKH